jgi:uncharacterized membrane protein YuzA (DUF378 family)
MANNEDVNQANQGAPAADIPDLKKKEKERKKAGAGWGGAKPGGGSFSGATGGAGARAAASAASSLGGAAGAAGAAGVAEAAGASWLSSMIASLTATVLGKAILAAGVAAFLVGAGLFGYAMLNGGGAGGAGGMGGDLGALSSSMKIRGDGGDRTGYVASNGEIMFDPLKAAEAKKAAAEKAPEDKGAGDAVPPGQTADAAGKGSGFNRPGLDHNMSGTKLSSSLGGGFGGKNIFSGSNAAPKFNENMAKTNIKGGDKGRLSAARKTTTGRTVAGGKAKGMKANKAFGQLKVAKGMSTQGASIGGAEGARTAATSAFDGQTGGSGNVVGGPTGGAGTSPVATPSGPGGAPDMTAPNVETPTGAFADPNTAAMLGAIAAMAKKAGEMKKQAEKLMMMGIALIILGAILWGPIGAIVAAIGAMLVGMSIMMSSMADMMKGMADSMSEGLAARTTDTKQNEINKYCIQKAYSEGSDPKNCNPPDSVTENQKINKNDAEAVQEHKDMVKETGRVEGLNGSPTGQ